MNPSWPIQAANVLRLLAFTLYLWTTARFGYHETVVLLMWMAREFFAGIQDVATFFRPGGQKNTLLLKEMCERLINLSILTQLNYITILDIRVYTVHFQMNENFVFSR